MSGVFAISEKILTKHLEVGGQTLLAGEVKVSGAKNSALVLLAATLLTKELVKIENVPELTDIDVMSELLSASGAKIFREKNHISVQTNQLSTKPLPDKLVHALRASFVCIGPLLARNGEVKMPLPGGCQIGKRPVDLHVKALSALGAHVEVNNGIVHAKVINKNRQLIGANIKFNFQSVGATETIIMAASLAKGETIIKNAAQEPEIQDLANMLNSMGAKIHGAGTSTITIHGVSKLHGCEYSVIPDRIEAGTFLIAAAITRSPLFIYPIIPNHLDALISKLNECGCSTTILNNGIKIIPSKIKSVNISTSPFPGFPTDLQAPFMALMSTAEGTSIFKENIFEDRMKHVNELKKMGANIDLIDEKTAIVKGVNKLHGGTVLGSDLRSAAAMVLAGLFAEGTSHIEGLHHLDRGYEKFEDKLVSVGARLTRYFSGRNAQPLKSQCQETNSQSSPFEPEVA